jgi:hypothetical protein
MRLKHQLIMDELKSYFINKLFIFKKLIRKIIQIENDKIIYWMNNGYNPEGTLFAEHKNTVNQCVHYTHENHWNNVMKIVEMVYSKNKARKNNGNNKPVKVNLF